MLKIDHINITVSDLEESIKFYQDVLGFKILDRFKGGMEFVFMTDGKVTYELIEGGRGSFDHIAYESLDIEKDFEKYKAHAVSSIGFIPFLFENGVRYFFMTGAGGEKIEFIQKL